MSEAKSFEILRIADWREAVKAWRALDPERNLRWVAEKTGSSLGQVSEFLSARHRRVPSSVFIGMLGFLMDLAPRERRYFEALVRADTAGAERARRLRAGDHVGADLYELEERAAWDEVRLVATLTESRPDASEGLLDRWVASVLYEMIECGALPPPARLATALLPAVTEAEARKARGWLLDSELVRSVDGVVTRVDDAILWFDAEDSSEDRRARMVAAHQRALRHFYWGLDTANVAREERDYRLAFKAMPREMLPDLQEKVNDLFAWIHTEAARRGGSDTVYVLGFQAVPATRPPASPGR